MPTLMGGRITRRSDGRIVAGVAAGLGAYFGVDANLVRLAFVVLSLAGGIGVLAYLAAWVLMPSPPSPEPPPRRASDPVQAAALGAVVLGVLLLSRASGLWFGDVFVWPLACAAIGIALLWMWPRQAGEESEVPSWPWLQRLPPAAAEAFTVLVGTRRGTLARVGAGLLLVAGGVSVFVASAGSWDAMRSGLVAALVVLAGLALALGPGLWRLASELVEERRERIRSDERADVAAHLHDSVLQTLALVQRRADDPREVVRLARLQERELRAWLLTREARGETGDGTSSDPPASLGGALETVAAIIEEEYGVPVEVVRVRDCPLAGLEPLLLAARECLLNAVRHSGASKVAVYLEVRDDNAVVFVRDRGRGFDPESVPADRGGLAMSVIGRLARNGGSVHIDSAPARGCEVEMSLPRRAHDNA
jgi:signal transduction histidine kinase/phage shock protein PspC (stress-responsive transcriptional regulator)